MYIIQFYIKFGMYWAPPTQCIAHKLSHSQVDMHTVYTSNSPQYFSLQVGSNSWLLILSEKCWSTIQTCLIVVLAGIFHIRIKVLLLKQMNVQMVCCSYNNRK